jgi:hypothetical protein
MSTDTPIEARPFEKGERVTLAPRHDEVYEVVEVDDWPRSIVVKSLTNPRRRTRILYARDYANTRREGDSPKEVEQLPTSTVADPGVFVPLHNVEMTSSDSEMELPKRQVVRYLEMATHPESPMSAGSRETWIRGRNVDTGAQFRLDSGAGLGNSHLSLLVEFPDGRRHWEYMDMTTLVEEWVNSIIANK